MREPQGRLAGGSLEARGRLAGGGREACGRLAGAWLRMNIRV